jgi:hypothetical protein
MRHLQVHLASNASRQRRLTAAGSSSAATAARLPTRQELSPLFPQSNLNSNLSTPAATSQPRSSFVFPHFGHTLQRGNANDLDAMLVDQFGSPTWSATHGHPSGTHWQLREQSNVFSQSSHTLQSGHSGLLPQGVDRLQNMTHDPLVIPAAAYSQARVHGSVFSQSPRTLQRGYGGLQHQGDESQPMMTHNSFSTGSDTSSQSTEPERCDEEDFEEEEEEVEEDLHVAAHSGPVNRDSKELVKQREGVWCFCLFSPLCF